MSFYTDIAHEKKIWRVYPKFAFVCSCMCSQTMCQPKLLLCAFTIVINSKVGGALKDGVLIVWYSHIDKVCVMLIGPRKLGGTKPKALG